MADGRACDSCQHLGRFMDKQRRAEQFSEDMRTVMYGGYGGYGSASSAPDLGRRTPGGLVRSRSPGLAAGAALALSAAAAEDARQACRQAAQHARGSGCPFDDHRAFGVPAEPERPRYAPPLAPDEARAAHQQARQMGKQNRELQQRVGAGAPWDAPERGTAVSSAAAAQRAVFAQPSSFAEQQQEALRNKSRMQGAEGLIAGGYLLGDTAQRNSSLPPRPSEGLLPQAQMKVQYDGGSLAGLTRERAAYLNSKVLAESNRERNEFNALQLR